MHGEDRHTAPTPRGPEGGSAAGRGLIEGRIVRLQPTRDADLVVALLSPNSGRVEAYARGGRSQSKRFGGRMELFVRGVAMLASWRGGLPTLSSFEPAADARPMATLDYVRLALASHAAELAYAASQPGQGDPALSAWLDLALKQLAAPTPVSPGAAAVRAARVGLELGVLAAIGAAPPLQACSACGGSLRDGAAWLRPHDGLTCRACTALGGRQLSADDLAALARLVCDPWDDAAALLPAARRLVQERAAGLLAEQFGRPTRSAAALDALGGGSG